MVVRGDKKGGALAHSTHGHIALNPRMPPGFARSNFFCRLEPGRLAAADVKAASSF
jgi:hypothetical protein